MSWAKINVDSFDRPEVLELPDAVQLMYLRGTLWSVRMLTDGKIPRSALRSLTTAEDAIGAAGQLVAAGLWAETTAGWEIVNFLKEQASKDKRERAELFSQERQQRYRQHVANDHSECRPDRSCRKKWDLEHGPATNGGALAVARTPAAPAGPDLDRALAKNQAAMEKAKKAWEASRS